MPEARPNAAPTPLTALGELRGWRISIRCGKCGRRARVTAESLADHQGSDVRLWRVLGRLRCARPLGIAGPARCGDKPSHVTAAEVRAHGKSITVLREVVLLDRERSRVTE